jgi:hypothetical protein
MKKLEKSDLEFIGTVEQALSAYAEKLQVDGMLNKQHIRLATKPTTTDLTGADGITRRIINPPKGMFLVVPSNAVASVQKALQLRSEERAGNYLSFKIGDKTFQIGSCSKNSLKSNADNGDVYEIWFDTQLGGSTAPVFNSFDEIFTALEERNLAGSRQVQEVTEQLTSAVQKQPDTVKLPF